MQIKLPASAFTVQDEDGNAVTPDSGDEITVSADGVVESKRGQMLTVRLTAVNGKAIKEQEQKQEKEDKEVTREDLIRELEKSEAVFGGG